MPFDAEARSKLDAIIHGATIGETVGILARRLTDDERAEKLTPRGILELSRQSGLTSTSAELLQATVSGLEAADAIGQPSNLDIRIHLHQSYREWVRTSPSASSFQNIHLARAFQSGHLGSFSAVERGGCDGMLRVAPIGLAFADDPGRAFQLGVRASALSDADVNSCLCGGVVTLVVALLATGSTAREAIETAEDFIRPIDCYGEVSEALRRSLGEDSQRVSMRGSASETLRLSLWSARTTDSVGDCIARMLDGEGNSISAGVAGQLAAVAHNLK